MSATWKTYNGIDVAVDNAGYFRAVVNGVFMQEDSWDRLRFRIEQEKKADAQALKLNLDCLVFCGDDSGEYSVQRAALVGLNRNDSRFKWARIGAQKNIQFALPYSKPNAGLLNQLAAAKSTVSVIEKLIKERVIYEGRHLGRIDPSKYNDELADLKARYERALEPAATPNGDGQ